MQRTRMVMVGLVRGGASWMACVGSREKGRWPLLWDAGVARVAWLIARLATHTLSPGQRGAAPQAERRAGPQPDARQQTQAGSKATHPHTSQPGGRGREAHLLPPPLSPYHHHHHYHTYRTHQQTHTRCPAYSHGEICLIVHRTDLLAAGRCCILSLQSSHAKPHPAIT